MPLSSPDLTRLADLMTEVKFTNGQFIVRQGDVGHSFYILIEGKGKVTQRKNADDELEAEKQLMVLEEYMYFGERALLHDAPRAANVVAVGNVKVLELKREHFESILGGSSGAVIDQHRKVREKHATGVMDSGVIKARKLLSGALRNDFEIFANGSFSLPSGTLLACRHTGSGQLFTLKAHSKAVLAGTPEPALFDGAAAYKFISLCSFYTL